MPLTPAGLGWRGIFGFWLAHGSPKAQPFRLKVNTLLQRF